MKNNVPATAILMCFTGLFNPVFANEPALPSGLGLSNEPSLPSGLDTLPTLPSGLGIGSDIEWEEEAPESSWEINGFADARAGTWLHDKPYLTDYSLAETRLNLNTEHELGSAMLALSVDLLYDVSAKEHQPNLETGQGWVDLRTASITFSPHDVMDIRIGRQTLTWGTGDLIFINDLFPKDWNAFLIGRDNTYLKAPSDAIKVSFFSQAANLDVIYTPRFDSDRYINGERASYYNPNLKQIAGTNAIIPTEKPDQWFSDDEIALRLYRNINTMEVALYGYQGYWKSPAGQNINTGKATFPRLNVYGASLLAPLLGGIANAEIGYYDSIDDKNGRNENINNSEFRLLIGYEHELIRNLSLSAQFYSTRMRDHGSYLGTLPVSIPAKKQDRHEVATRLTWVLLEQKLISTLYLRYSPTDKDYYIRPKLKYSMNDHWTYEIGANIFGGNHAHTFFGQFGTNDNVYAALRYGL